LKFARLLSLKFARLLGLNFDRLLDGIDFSTGGIFSRLCGDLDAIDFDRLLGVKTATNWNQERL
jgi:hypothetical protein